MDKLKTLNPDDLFSGDDIIDCGFTTVSEPKKVRSTVKKEESEEEKTERLRRQKKKLPENKYKKTRCQWTESTADRAKMLFLKGYSLRKIGEIVGMTYVAVSNKARRENWAESNNVPKKLLKAVSEGVSNIVRAKTDKQLNNQIESEIDKRLDVLRKHRADLEHISVMVVDIFEKYNEVQGSDEEAIAERSIIAEKLRVSKMAVETLSVLQKSERAAWYLEQAKEREIMQPIQINNFTENKFTEVAKKLLENV